MDDSKTLTRRELVQRGVIAASAAGMGGVLVDDALAEALSTLQSPSRGGTLRVAVSGSPQDVLNPFGGNSRADGFRDSLIYEPLAGRSQTGDGIRLILAESITPSGGGRAWTVRLRPGVRFHDGSQLDAQDVIFSFEAAKKEEDYLGGLEIAGIRAMGARTVRFTLNSVVADWPERLSLLELPFIVTSRDRDYADGSLGTGPYRLRSFRPGISTSLVANRRYWGRGSRNMPYLDGVELLAIAAPEARINALRGGQVDYVIELPYAAAKANENSKRLLLRRTPIADAIHFFSINARVKPLDDNRVRLALKLACNRRELMDRVLFGFGTPGNDLVSGMFADVDPKLKPRSYDPNRARALLRQAGADGFKLVITAASSAGTEVDAATLYAEQLRRVGVDATVDVITPAQLFSNLEDFVTTGQMLSFQGANEPFVINAATFMISASPFNLWGWLRPAWDKRFASAQAILDTKRRQAAYRALQKEFYDEGGMVTWAFSSTVHAAAPRVRGDRKGPFNLPDLGGAWLTKR